MRIIRPHELKSVLEGDTAVVFLSDTYWKPLPMYAEELERLKVSYLPFKKGETVHDDNQTWAVDAHIGWLVHTQMTHLEDMTYLPLKPDTPVGGLIHVWAHPDPHIYPAELIAQRPVISWAVANGWVWVRKGHEQAFLDIGRVDWGEALKSNAIVFHTGDALICSPQGGRRPYTLYRFPLSPKIW